MNAISLITLNVEGNKHIDTVLPFLRQENPDVFCLQEVFEQDAEMYAKELGYEHFFSPMVKKPYEGEQKDEGIAIYSKLSVLGNGGAYYHRPHPTQILDYDDEQKGMKKAFIATCYLWIDVQKSADAAPVRFATTHFTWTPDGFANEDQKTDVVVLMKDLELLGDMVLCGDFNMPRGYNEVYDILTEKFKDNIPPDQKTTMDIANHRVKDDPVESKKMSNFVVDYIFTTPAYVASNVKVEFGVSDHAAVSARIEVKK